MEWVTNWTFTITWTLFCCSFWTFWSAQVLGFGIWIGLWPRACQLCKTYSTKQQQLSLAISIQAPLHISERQKLLKTRFFQATSPKYSKESLKLDIFKVKYQNLMKENPVTIPQNVLGKILKSTINTIFVHFAQKYWFSRKKNDRSHWSSQQQQSFKS